MTNEVTLDVFLNKEDTTESPTFPKVETITRLPKGWRRVKLGKVAKTTSGGTPRRSVKEFFGGDIPWVKSGELEDGYIWKTEETITKEGLKNSSAKLFPKGTLIVAMYGATVGKTGILGVEAATNQAVCAIFPNENLADKLFIRYFIMYKRPELLKNSFGGAQPNISQRVIRNLVIPLPPLEEQRRIVARIEEIMSRIEQAKKLREEALKDTEAIMHSALYHIFIKAEEKEWESKRLGEICNHVRYGLTAKSSTIPEGILFIRITDIDFDGNLSLTEPHYVKANEDTIEKFSIRKGDILIARSGATAGKAYLCDVETKAVFASYLIRFRFKEEIVMPKFVFYFLQSPYYWKQLQVRKVGGAQPNVNAQNLKSLKIPLPPLEQQRNIVAYLDDLREKISILKKYQRETEEKIKAMTQAILKRAFSGEL